MRDGNAVMLRLVIDMQSTQTGSNLRGIGRYTRELTKNLLLACKNKLEVFLIFNGQLPTEKSMDYFAPYITRDHMKVWTYYPRLEPGENQDAQNSSPIELFYEWFYSQFNADIIWSPSLFEGGTQGSIITWFASANDLIPHVVTTLHDITPLIMSQKYLQRRRYKRWYMRKLHDSISADTILTVSEFAKRTIHEYLGVDLNKIVVNYPGCDHGFWRPDPKYSQFGNKENYFFYVGSGDMNKNVSTLVEAYCLLDEVYRRRCKLIIAGQRSADDVSELEKIAFTHLNSADDIRFLGQIDDNKLLALMQRCKAFIFPSLLEGFGSPPLEAMACGAPTLVSAHSSMCEVMNDKRAQFDPRNAYELSHLMTKLMTDNGFGQDLIDVGITQAQKFSYELAAKKLLQVFLSRPRRKRLRSNSQILLAKKAELANILPSLNYQVKGELAQSFVDSQIFACKKRIFWDVSNIVEFDYITGIQRFVYDNIRSFGTILSDKITHGTLEVVPIYETNQVNKFCRAKFIDGFYCPVADPLPSDRVEFHDGDILILADLNPSLVVRNHDYFLQLCNRGIRVINVLHDIITITNPEYFFDLSDFKDGSQHPVVAEHEKFLACIAQYSGVVAISKTVLENYQNWRKTNQVECGSFYFEDYNHPGVYSTRATGNELIEDENIYLKDILEKNDDIPMFLMVSTIEPRKGHKVILDAFEKLWSENEDVLLVFVGRPGWLMDDFIDKIKNHRELNKHFFWLNGVSDEYVMKLYSVCTGVIVASYDEGFGLATIEGAQFGKPLFLRDVRIFREIAGSHATYFKDERAIPLAASIKQWMLKIKEHTVPDSSKIKLKSWQDSAHKLIEIIDPILLKKTSRR